MGFRDVRLNCDCTEEYMVCINNRPFFCVDLKRPRLEQAHPLLYPQNNLKEKVWMKYGYCVGKFATTVAPHPLTYSHSYVEGGCDHPPNPPNKMSPFVTTTNSQQCVMRWAIKDLIYPPSWETHVPHPQNTKWMDAWEFVDMDSTIGGLDVNIVAMYLKDLASIDKLVIRVAYTRGGYGCGGSLLHLVLFSWKIHNTC